MSTGTFDLILVTVTVAAIGIGMWRDRRSRTWARRFRDQQP